MDFNKWLDVNKLDYEQHSDNTLSIKDFGSFILIDPKDDKIIADDFTFILTDEEVEKIVEDKIKYLVFEFGDRYFYSSIKTKKNEYNEDSYVPEFNDFRNIGKISSQMDIPFVNLGIRGEYELLNGSGLAKDWVKKAKFLNHTALGISDKNTLAGTLPFQLACDKENIKSILGATITVAYDYDDKLEHQIVFDLKVYVENAKGWRNLLKINKAINVDFNRFIPEELFLTYTEGLSVVFATDSIFNEKIDDFKFIVKLINKYKAVIKNLYYQIDSIEYVSDATDIKHLNNIKTYLNKYSKAIKPILINDCHYIERDDYAVKDLLNKVAKKADHSSKTQYFKNVDEVIEIFTPFCDENTFEHIQNAIDNTTKLAEYCNYKIEIGKHKLPKFECDDSEGLFYKLLQEGVEKKLGDVEDIEIYLDRLETECNVIVPAGFIDYFLILWDVVKYAKDSDIMVGPGRGSVGGSLIAYLLDITDVDPVQFNLLFERFLNAARLSGERALAADSLPDVDLDFQAERRDDIKRYIEQKYTYENSCSIGTYTRMKLKSGLKDFGRAKGLPFDLINIITKDIDDEHEYTWGDLIQYAVKSPKLKEFVQNNSDICLVLKTVLNQAKVGSIHPSALLILPKEDAEGNRMTVYDWLPVKKIDGYLVSEWEGKYVERAGFLKEDILGLSQLDKFKYILKLIKESQGKDVVLRDIPLNNRATYKLFEKGLNEDVFQFSSGGLKSYTQKLKPDNIEDLIAANALYRPGPMESNAHMDFALIKQGKKKAVFDYMLQDVTKNTFGLYIYQEQIMQAVHVLGGLSLVEADEVRTIMKKFDEKGMLAFEKKFIAGAIKNKCKKEDAEKIWKKLLAFSGYGFNRSHSAAYALMSYWSQWLKANYPLEFWTASLQHSRGEDEIPNRISELNKLELDIIIKSPDVNKSGEFFALDKDANSIYWSISKIKGVGKIAVDNILATRDAGGKFFSFEEFISRVPKQKVNKTIVTRLILAGCFDELENLVEQSGRKELLADYYKTIKAEMPVEYLSPEASRNTFWILLQKDFTGHGDINYKDLLIKASKDKYLNKNYIDGLDFLNNKKDWRESVICGRVLYVVERSSKKGKFCQITIEHNNNLIFITLWNEIYVKYKKQLADVKHKLIAVSGKIKFDTWRGTNVLYSEDGTKLIEL